MLLRSVVSTARSFTRTRAGNNNPARMAMMSMTTNNSIKVNAMAIRAGERGLGFMIEHNIERAPECQRRPKMRRTGAHLDTAAGPRTVPVRSGLAGVKTLGFSEPPRPRDVLRAGTARA